MKLKYLIGFLAGFALIPMINGVVTLLLAASVALAVWWTP